jgi:hypothetical protein
VVLRGKPVNQQQNLTTEARSHGEKHGERREYLVIGAWYLILGNIYEFFYVDFFYRRTMPENPSQPRRIWLGHQNL